MAITNKLVLFTVMGFFVVQTQTALAQGNEGSLIESALESEAANLRPAIQSAGTASTQNQQPEADNSGTADNEASLAESKRLSNTAEPEGINQLPIHSPLPSGTSTFFGKPYRVKVGKSYPLDPVYRGKPALPETPTLSVGTPSWAIPQKKKVAGLPLNPTPANSAAPVPRTENAAGQASSIQSSNSKTAGEAGKEDKNKELRTLNMRFLTPRHMRPSDSIWIYPYPPKPPKQIHVAPLPEEAQALKNQILNHGYTFRPDLNRPYPAGGWRWVHAFDAGLKKSGQGLPHTMITMYPWVNKVFPFIQAECRELNKIEAQRSERYMQVMADYDRIHVDIETQAALKNLSPCEIKVNSRGIAQHQLPPGNWWIAAVRKCPGLKFYWQVPLTVSDGQNQEPLNVQFTEANALVVGGGW